MKKLILFSVFLVALSFQSHACDVCGCKLGGMYMGILPQFSSHFIGIRYSYAAFHASIKYDSEYLDDETSYDVYHRMELTGRYSFSKKIQLFAILPYAWNKMDGSHQVAEVNGIGDPVLVGYYTLLDNTSDFSSPNKHYLLAGAGIKLPFGDNSFEDNGEIINRNFQLGTGSIDYILSANYTFRRNQYGFNAEASYKMNTENSDQYRFGNETNMNLALFYSMEKEKFSLMPYAGIHYELAGQHTEDRAMVLNTGGHSVLGTIGTQFYKDNWIFTLQVEVPLSQSYNTDEYSSITGDIRFSAGVIFNLPGSSTKN